MSRLYTRILLSLWIVIAGVALGAVGLTWVVLLEHADNLGRAPGHLSRAATEALSEGGEAGLKSWLQQAIAKHRDFHIYVIGPDGRELLDRPLPPHVDWIAQRPPDEERGAGEPPPAGSAADRTRPLAARLLPPRPVPVLVSANGVEYLLVIVPHRGVLGPFEQPWLRIGLLAMALLFTALASLWLTKSISRPVAALALATRSLADGDLAARVDPAVSQRRDELGGLGRDFDAMAKRLHEQIEAKERLLQDISHELRSPLARMRVALGLARQPGASIGVQLDRLELETERLNALIGQVLALSRLSDPTLHAGAERIDLGDLVDGIARDAAFEGQARGVAIDWQPPAEPITVIGDAPLLASAIENVVRNALRYTPEHSTVRIAILSPAAPGAVSIVVGDGGPGVPEAELKRIFAPFHRVASSRGRDSGGDGLGLAITDRVMRAHAGVAQAVNRAGGGLEVSLTLPRAP